MVRPDRHTREAQIQQVWRMLLESKTHEEIARELGVATKTIQRISIELDKRYGESQRQKTNDTIYLECNLFKNRMLTLYKGLEKIVTGMGHSGGEKAKCAEVAANICIDILKMESEGIKSITEYMSTSLNDHAKGHKLFNSISQQQSATDTTEQSNTTDKRDMVPRDMGDPEESC